MFLGLTAPDSSDDDFEEVSSNKTASPARSLNNTVSNGVEMDLVIGRPSKGSPKKSPRKASPRKPTCKTPPKKACVLRSSPRKLSPKGNATSTQSACEDMNVVRRIELVSIGCGPMESGNELEVRLCCNYCRYRENLCHTLLKCSVEFPISCGVPLVAKPSGLRRKAGNQT